MGLAVSLILLQLEQGVTPFLDQGLQISNDKGNKWNQKYLV